MHRSRRNNFSTTSGVQPFSGAGRTLGGYRSRRGFLPGLRSTAGAIWNSGLGPYAAGVASSAFGRGTKRKVSDMLSKKKSILQGRVMNEGTGGQYSMFTIPKRKCYLPPHVENALPPLVIQGNSAGQLKSAVGLQNVVSPLSLFSPSVATTYTGDKVTRVLYQKATADITMNNIYLSNAYVIIYDIIARKDLSTATFNNPANAWAQGDTDEGTGTAYTFLGSNPWQVEVFNQFFKVVQVTNVVLGAGATHVHKVRMEPNKIVSSAQAQYTTGALADCTYWCMIEVHGSPANDTTTQTQVSIGAGGLNYIVDYEYTLKQLQKATPTIACTNSLLTSFTNGEQVVNLGGSLIQANAEG